MNLQKNIRRILSEETNSEELSSYLDVTPFYKLPYPYQKSLMIMRNEGTTTDVEIKDLIDDFSDNITIKYVLFSGLKSLIEKLFNIKNLIIKLSVLVIIKLKVLELQKNII
jgi:hypothetical protein